MRQPTKTPDRRPGMFRKTYKDQCGNSIPYTGIPLNSEDGIVVVVRNPLPIPVDKKIDDTDK